MRYGSTCFVFVFVFQVYKSKWNSAICLLLCNTLPICHYKQIFTLIRYQSNTWWNLPFVTKVYFPYFQHCQVRICSLATLSDAQYMWLARGKHIVWVGRSYTNTYKGLPLTYEWVVPPRWIYNVFSSETRQTFTNIFCHSPVSHSPVV